MAQNINTAQLIDNHLEHIQSEVDNVQSRQAQKPAQTIKVLIAHESHDIANAIKSVFHAQGWLIQPHRTHSEEDLIASIEQDSWDFIFAFQSSELFSIELINNYANESTEIRKIFLANQYDENLALFCMQNGFHDFLCIEENARLLFVVNRELAAKNHLSKLKKVDSSLTEITARSELLLNSTHEAIAYVTDGMIVHANQQFADLLQFSNVEDLDCYPFIDLINSTDQEKIKPILRAFQLGKQTDTTSQTPLPIQVNTQAGETIAAKLSINLASFDAEQCTQIILRKDSDEKAPVSPEQDTREFCLGAMLEKISVGSLIFMGIANNAEHQKELGINEYPKLILQIDRYIKESISEQAQVYSYQKDNWIIALPAADGHDIQHLVQTLFDALRQQSYRVNNKEYTIQPSLGASQYGISNLTAESALDKAFNISVEKQVSGGGFKVYMPKLKNSTSLEAVQNGLSHNRFALKFQPVISLLNQEKYIYETVPQIKNDSDQLENAFSLIDSLGLEKENIAFDQWQFQNILHAIETSDDSDQSPTDKQLLIMPLTASVVVNDINLEWLNVIENYDKNINGNICFSIDAELCDDHLENVKQLSNAILSQGFNFCLHNVDEKHQALFALLKPDYIKMHGNLTRRLHGEDANPELIKSVIQIAIDSNVKSIATGISSANELAQLWATQVSYIQSSYLQEPMDDLNYDFSQVD